MLKPAVIRSTPDEHQEPGMIATQNPLRVLLAKVGLDGHDRGVKVVARGLRDSGFHVIYGGIWQSPAGVAQSVLDEDADWLGLSLLNGAHMTLVPRVIDALRDVGCVNTGILVGGIIPQQDIPKLEMLGVAGVFGPGSSIESIVAFMRNRNVKEPPVDVTELVRRCQTGRRDALTKLLTWVAHHGAYPENLPPPRSDKVIRCVGITGSPGVGKSSLIACLIRELRQQGRSVAVLACDPQSPLTGGALLGDRVRMSDRLSDDGVMIRSLAAPCGSQGIVENIELMIQTLKWFGFDMVLIESVGVGQGDVAVSRFVDSLVLLLQPESGDSIQWEKAGLLEVADLIVIQKSDLPGADRLETELNEHLNLPGYQTRPIFRVSCTQAAGIRELAEHLTKGSVINSVAAACDERSPE
jgi:LAO/AO transport system ATPase